jgi:hypothetical protein
VLKYTGARSPNVGGSTQAKWRQGPAFPGTGSGFSRGPSAADFMADTSNSPIPDAIP